MTDACTEIVYRFDFPNPLPERVVAYFCARVTVGAPDACWLWQGPRRLSKDNADTYGDVGLHHPRPQRGFAFRELAHRVAFRLSRGEIPDDLYVLHRCDVRLCCNPAHLGLGTYQDNVDDMIAKGRKHIARGSKNQSARLNEAQAVEIRRRATAGEDQNALAAEFGVSQTLVSNIRTGRAWRHV